MQLSGFCIILNSEVTKSPDCSFFWFSLSSSSILFWFLARFEISSSEDETSVFDFLSRLPIRPLGSFDRDDEDLRAYLIEDDGRGRGMPNAAMQSSSVVRKISNLRWMYLSASYWRVFDGVDGVDDGDWCRAYSDLAAASAFAGTGVGSDACLVIVAPASLRREEQGWKHRVTESNKACTTNVCWLVEVNDGDGGITSIRWNSMEHNYWWCTYWNYDVRRVSGPHLFILVLSFSYWRSMVGELWWAPPPWARKQSKQWKPDLFLDFIGRKVWY